MRTMRTALRWMLRVAAAVKTRVPKAREVRAVTGAATLTISGSLSASDFPPDQIEFFESKIRPILAESCYKCHSAESGKSKADLRLDTRDTLRRGGGSGPAIVPGDPEKSLLIEAVRYSNSDLQMPPEEEGGKLAADKIALLEA